MEIFKEWFLVQYIASISNAYHFVVNLNIQLRQTIKKKKEKSLPVCFWLAWSNLGISHV